jgi:hypothetical protein
MISSVVDYVTQCCRETIVAMRAKGLSSRARPKTYCKASLICY